VQSAAFFFSSSEYRVGSAFEVIFVLDFLVLCGFFSVALGRGSYRGRYRPPPRNANAMKQKIKKNTPALGVGRFVYSTKIF
jgi:hypothetical protein